MTATPRRSAPLLALALALALAACGGGGDGGPTTPRGDPITGLVVGDWSWIDFPDSACSDGSPTGVGVSPGTGPDLLVYLEGGGACASGTTCFTYHTATLGPFGAAEFEALKAQRLPGSILDRALPGNPFADATLVYVPYCTGDVHGGDQVVAYADGPGGIMHHVGHLNWAAFLKRLAATYPAPRRAVLTGASAGGFGTLVSFPLFRAYWPAAKAYVVDDSGPPLPSNGGPLIQAGFQRWGIAHVLDPLCGPGVCEADLSRGLAALSARYPGDRFALLSWQSDPTISAFYVMDEAAFPPALQALVTDVIAGAANERAFVAAGDAHTMLGAPGAVSQGGVGLLDWLALEVSGDDAAWQTFVPW